MVRTHTRTRRGAPNKQKNRPDRTTPSRQNPARCSDDAVRINEETGQEPKKRNGGMTDPCSCGCNGANTDRRLITTTQAFEIMWQKGNVFASSMLTIISVIIAGFLLAGYTYAVWTVATKAAEKNAMKITGPDSGTKTTCISAETVIKLNQTENRQSNATDYEELDSIPPYTNRSRVLEKSNESEMSIHIYDEPLKPEEVEHEVTLGEHGGYNDGINLCNCTKTGRRRCGCKSP